MELEPEIWLPIRNWEGKYYISSHGRFKSIGGKYTLKHPDGYITYGYPETQGYRCVTLRAPGIYERDRLHFYVAEYFCEKIKGDECVNHLDGNKWNNYYKNLEWDTRKGNVLHAVETGLMDFKGEKHPSAKLTTQKVIEMRELRKQGMTYSKLGEMFGVERRQASDVVRGVNWGWLTTGLDTI